MLEIHERLIAGLSDIRSIESDILDTINGFRGGLCLSPEDVCMSYVQTHSYRILFKHVILSVFTLHEMRMITIESVWIMDCLRIIIIPVGEFKSHLVGIHNMAGRLSILRHVQTCCMSHVFIISVDSKETELLADHIIDGIDRSFCERTVCRAESDRNRKRQVCHPCIFAILNRSRICIVLAAAYQNGSCCKNI